jgi:hypothetical protein
MSLPDRIARVPLCLEVSFTRQPLVAEFSGDKPLQLGTVWLWQSAGRAVLSREKEGEERAGNQPLKVTVSARAAGTAPSGVRSRQAS